MALGVYLPRRLRSPWELSRIDAPVERMMQRMFSDFLSPSSTSEELLSFEPQIDVVESENEIRVTAELPGLSEENVDIELRNEGLLLRGEKKQETKSEDKEGRPRTIERMYGMFERKQSIGQVLPRRALALIPCKQRLPYSVCTGQADTPWRIRAAS